MNNKTNLINLQILAIIGFIIGLLLSFLLSYNEKLLSENKVPIFDNKQAQTLNILRAGLIFIVTLVFLYINYISYQVCDANEKNTSFLNFESTLLSVIVAIIGIYIAITNYNKSFNLIEIENI